MGKAIQIRVDESLTQLLERIRVDVANSLKKTYNLDEITINGTLTSKILACKLNGQKNLSFTIRKVGLNKGVLELV